MSLKDFAAARAALAAFVLFAGGTPAIAGRGTQVDILNYVAPCSFGATDCPSGAYSYQSLDISATGHFSRAYVYSNGVVSFDTILPSGANSNDVDSLGGGTWFAPGFSSNKNYGVSAYLGVGGSAFALNFYEPGLNIWGTQDDPDTEEDEFVDAAIPSFQVFFTWIYGDDPENKWDGVEVSFGYNEGVELAEDALIGFNVWGTRQTVRNANGLKVGPAGGDTDFATQFGIYTPVLDWIQDTDENGDPLYDEYGNLQGYEETRIERSAPTLFNALYDEVQPDPVEVPEPATLGSLALGLGLLGAARRRRRTVA